MAQLAEWCGANNLSLNVRQRRLWWTSGKTLMTTPHWPSTARLWRDSAAPNSWGCTSQKTSPGPPTLHHSPRRCDSAYTLSASWKEQVSLHPSSPLSTGEPVIVCWPAASLSGTGTECSRPQDPPADSEHSCKDHRCPSPLHPVHFPCTMLQ